MRRHRRLLLCALAGLATVPATLALAQTATPEPEDDPQAFFAKELLDDPRTSAPIKRLLRTKAGFVDARSGFVDVTGDGRSDAIVLVTMPGIAGTVAMYLFTTDGGTGEPSEKLRAVFRTQGLHRATFKVRPGTLVIRTPVHARGDEPHLPARIEERDYAWTPSSASMRRVDRRTFDGPGAPPSRTGTTGTTARR